VTQRSTPSTGEKEIILATVIDTCTSARAGGNDVKWDDEGATCSDGLYSVNLYRVSDGQCFYSEFETDPTKTF